MYSRIAVDWLPKYHVHVGTCSVVVIIIVGVNWPSVILVGNSLLHTNCYVAIEEPHLLLNRILTDS